MFAFPATDGQFRATAETALGNPHGRPIDDTGVLAAPQALLQATYPLATLRVRPEAVAARRNLWEAFRDPSSLDDELVRRGRAGDASALDDLYDRHQQLSYAMAIQTAGPTDAALDAVATAFASVIYGDDGEPDMPVRCRLARAARDAGGTVHGASDGPGDRVVLQRAVVELARVRGLSGVEISAILRRDIAEIRLMAIDGLKNAFVAPMDADDF